MIDTLPKKEYTDSVEGNPGAFCLPTKSHCFALRLDSLDKNLWQTRKAVAFCFGELWVFSEGERKTATPQANSLPEIESSKSAGAFARGAEKKGMLNWITS